MAQTAVESFNVASDIPLGFLPAFGLTGYRSGPLGIVSQSGGVLTNLLSKVADRSIGLSYAASTGNEPDLSWVDFLDFMVHDPSTRAVAVYVEGMPTGDRFVAVAHEALRLGKPIVLLKGGRSTSGQAAAASHTAALATSQRALEAVAERYAVTLVYDVDDLIDTAAYLASDRQCGTAPILALGTSGGSGVMTADALEEHGVPMARMTQTTVGRLAEVLPPFAVLRNPLDMSSQYLNDPSLFRGTIAELGHASEVGALFFSLAMITEGYAERLASDIVDADQVIDTPITVCWSGGSVTEGGVRILQQAGFPVFRRLETAARAMRASGEFRSAASRVVVTASEPAPSEVISLDVPSEGLSEHAAAIFLAAQGLPMARSRLASTLGEAEAFAEEIGYPVALKISSALIRHKSDAGGVKLGIGGVSDLRRAFNELRDLPKLHAVRAPRLPRSGDDAEWLRDDCRAQARSIARLDPTDWGRRDLCRSPGGRGHPPRASRRGRG